MAVPIEFTDQIICEYINFPVNEALAQRFTSCENIEGHLLKEINKKNILKQYFFRESLEHGRQRELSVKIFRGSFTTELWTLRFK